MVRMGNMRQGFTVFALMKHPGHSVSEGGMQNLAPAFRFCGHRILEARSQQIVRASTI
jgi:hypothetical protein